MINRKTNPACEYNVYTFYDDVSRRNIKISAYNYDNALKALKGRLGVKAIFFKLIKEESLITFITGRKWRWLTIWNLNG